MCGDIRIECGHAFELCLSAEKLQVGTINHHADEQHLYKNINEWKSHLLAA